MTGSTMQWGFTPEAFVAFRESRKEPSWLTLLREDAWGWYRELDFPNATEEEWRRTDLRSFRLDAFGLPVAPAPGLQPPTGLLAHDVDLAGQTVVMDSHRVRSDSSYDLARQGVLLGNFEDFLLSHGDLLRPYLESRLVDLHRDKFAALHGAFWSGGTLLYVPRGVSIERPVHILSAVSAGGVDLGRAMVVLEEGAEATVLAETASVDPSAPGMHCGVIELFVGSGARLRYVNLQNWGAGVWHFAHQRAQVDQEGQLQWTAGALGARLAKVNQHVVLAGRGAAAQVNGVMFTEGRQTLSYHTLQHHQAPECRSDLLYKGALQDRSHIIWRGMIRVDRDAQRTDGYQRDDNLLLSNAARVDCIPGLEILADDVKCTHGATAGRVDEEQIFYACSRGLTPNEASQMVVSGFFQQVFDRITIPSVRDALRGAILRRVRQYE